MSTDAANSQRGRSARVTVRVENGIAVVTVHPPDPGVRVAHRELAAAFRDACSEVSADEAVRVVLLRSAGGDFWPGPDEAPSAEDAAAVRVASSVGSLPQPVVAALRGSVRDQGLEIALAADIRIAAEGSRFAVSAVVRGRLPFDGGTQRLPRVVGPGTATDMLLTGRELDARVALAAGLVTEVVAPDEMDARAFELAGKIAGRGALAARYAKEAVCAGLEMTLEQGLGLEADLSILLQSSPERAEGISAFLERRPPRFPPDAV